MDASSPARVPFLARLGPPFQSTFRPQEALTSHVLAGAVAAMRKLLPDYVIEGGDLIDNNQANELRIALDVLSGGPVRPGSGPDGYFGVQNASNPDPFYYRPDVDAPRHPGLLRAATRPFAARGLGVPWVPVLGDHDALVAGEIVPTELTRSLALGGRSVWDLPAGFNSARPPQPPGRAGRAGRARRRRPAASRGAARPDRRRARRRGPPRNGPRRGRNGRLPMQRKEHPSDLPPVLRRSHPRTLAPPRIARLPSAG